MPDDASGLIDALYREVVAPAGWRAWLDRACAAVAAVTGVLLVGFEPPAGGRAVLVSGGPDRSRGPPSLAACRDALCEDARRFARAPAFRQERVLLSDVLDERALRETRCHREWLRPRGLHHALVGIVRVASGAMTGLALFRRPDRAAFGTTASELVRGLLPHLQQALHVEETLAEAALRVEAARVALASLRCAALVSDAEARVCAGNERAAAWLARRGGIRVDPEGRLRAEDPRDTPPLRSLVAAAAGAPGRPPRAGVLALARGGERHALVVAASPLQPSAARGAGVASERALLLFSDPEELPALHESALRRLYGFTGAEARAAARLARGETAGEIAVALGVRRTTVRTHLQQALQKTGTHRQAELVRLLLMDGRLGPGEAPGPCASSERTMRPRAGPA